MTQFIGDIVSIGTEGSIQLVDVMGNDLRIVDAARISFGGGKYESTEKNRNLIRYLMRHRHTTPFEQVEMAFIIRCPMDVWRQWIRHRTANVNEYSTRYTKAIAATAKTDADAWRLQDQTNRQGSSPKTLPLEIGAELTEREAQLHQLSRSIYEERLHHGVANEQARKDLPLSTYTEAYWKVDLHNLLHFLELRMDSHAQLEIREFANAIFYSFVKPMFPLTAEAFMDYRLDAVTFTGPEMRALTHFEFNGSSGGFGIGPDSGLSDREQEELKIKARRFFKEARGS